MPQQSSAVINWCFTINNPHPYDEDVLKALFPDVAAYLIFGREVGKKGTPHLQGYLQLKKKKRFTAMKKIHKEAHWEPAEGDQRSNFNYCTKDGDYVELGVPTSGKRGAPTMLERAARNQLLRDTPIDELVSSGEISLLQVRALKNCRMDLEQLKPAFAASDVRGTWIWGPPGTGKSRSAREDYGDDIYLKAQNKWWDGYTGQKVVILDDMDTDVLGHYLKIWADRYACTGEIKGGTVNLRHEKFIVTSNFSIESLFEKPEICAAIKRRFNVVYMGETADMLVDEF